MRKALNDNPMVQLAVVAGLLVVVGLLALTRMGGDEPAEDPAATGTQVEASLSVNGEEVATGTATLPGATAGAAPPVAGSTSSTTGSVSPEALVPGPGLPAPVAAAWKRGDAVVLLIVRPKGVDDRLVRTSVAALEGDSGITVFVAPAGDVARYSRITQGVGVSQVPALVVVRPQSVSGAVPQATVSYGFRSTQSVVQAVEDALYDGRDDVPYHPG
jgi:hypothetical protein